MIVVTVNREANGLEKRFFLWTIFTAFQFQFAHVLTIDRNEIWPCGARSIT